MSVIDRTLRGDIETIIRTALAKEQPRRYQSAAEFAADIRHYRANEPIDARPASAFYQVRKFARRNRALVGGAAVVFLVSIIGTVVATRYAFIANQNAEVIERREQAAVWQNYQATIRAALRFIDQGRFPDAHAALLGAPEQHRGWEWRHLMAQFPASSREWETLSSQASSPISKPVMNREGSEAFIAYKDGTLLGWDTATGSIRFHHQLPSEPMHVAIDPEHRRVAATDPSGTIAIRSINDDLNFEVITLSSADGRAEMPRPLSWSADGTTLLIARGHELLLWSESVETTDLDNLRALDVQRSPGFTRFIDNDSRIVATLSGSPGFIIIDADSMTIETRFHELTESFTCFDYDPNQRIIAGGGLFRNVLLVNVDDGQLVRRLTGHRKAINSVCFTDNGSTLISASDDGAVRKWRVATGDELQALESGDTTLAALALEDADDVVLFSDRILEYEWTRGTGRHLGTHLPYVYYIAFSPDGDIVASTCHYAKTVRLWSTRGDGLVNEFPAATGGWHINATPSIHFSDDGSTLFTMSGSELVTVSLPTGSVDREKFGTMWSEKAPGMMNLDDRPLQVMHSIAYFPNLDTTFRLVTNHARIEVLRRGEITDILENTNNESAVVPSPDGTQVAITRSDGIVDIRDVETLEVINQFKGHSGSAFAAAFHPTEPRLATGDEGGIVRIFDLNTAELLLEFHDHTQYIHDLEFSADGTMLASASGDGTVRLWSTRPRSEGTER